VAISSQVVGLPAPLEDGGNDAGLEVAGRVLVWPPLVAALLSLLSFAQPAAATAITPTSSESQKLIFDRSNLLCLCEVITGNFLSLVDLNVGSDAA
jgi:hypothetical protein